MDNTGIIKFQCQKNQGEHRHSKYANVLVLQKDIILLEIHFGKKLEVNGL